MQEYLLPNNGMTNKEKSFAFSARTQTLDVKCNFKSGKSDLRCSMGCDSNEDQEHLLLCPALNDDGLSAVPKRNLQQQPNESQESDSDPDKEIQ